MFFDQVLLSKKSWHYRLQDWTFGYVPYTNNFCPFFWLTIFCLLIFPFTGGYRGSKWLLVGGFKLFYLIIDNTFGRAIDLFDSYLCKPWYERQMTTRVKSMDDESAFRLIEFIFISPFYYFDVSNKNPKINIVTHHYKFDRLGYKQRLKYLDQWYRWKDKHEDWEDHLITIYNRREKYKKETVAYRKTQEEAERRAEKRAEINRKKLMAALVKYTRYVAIVGVVAIGCGLVYLSALLIQITVNNWNDILGTLWTGLCTIGTFLWWFAYYAAMGIIPVIVLVGLVIFIVALIKKCNVSLPGTKTFEKVGDGFMSVVNFFAIFAKTFKENNCPAIEWEEDQQES